MLYVDIMFVLGLFPVITILSLLDRSAEYKNMLLIIGSLIFLSWGKPVYVLILTAFTLFDWFMGLCQDKFRERKKLFLFLSGAVNTIALAILGNDLFKSLPKGFAELNALLPLCVGGILLRGFSYNVQVFKREIKAEKNFFCLLTYTTALHLLGGGQVPNYSSAEPYIRKRELTIEKLSDGLTKIFLGMGKVVILSRCFGDVALGLFKDTSLLGQLIGMLCFFMQCYYLFTGIWDMSNGLALTFGFPPEKSYRPLTLKSINSLMMNFNSTVSKFFKLNSSKGYCLLAGGVLVCLWYRVSLSFLVMGIMLGTVCLLENRMNGSLKKLPRAAKALLTFLLMIVIFSPAYFGDISRWGNWLGNIFTVKGGFGLSSASGRLILNNIFVLLLGFVLSSRRIIVQIKLAVRKLERNSPSVYRPLGYLKTIFVICVFLISAAENVK